MDRVCIMEVGPRDGFQSVGPQIPTETKIDLVRSLADCGFTQMEVGSFVSTARLPQMADVRDVMATVGNRTSLTAAVLVPNKKGAALAMAAGARGLVTVVSASQAHNRANIGRSIEESMDEFCDVLRSTPSDTYIRFNIATSFHCPFEGAVAPAGVIAIIRRALEARADIEIGLCDTIGKATPHEVGALFRQCMREFSGCRWAFHGHDTYGFGIANVLAAYEAGVGVIDGAAGGLGGCPFAPGASGNVATEDVVYTFERLGVATGIALAPLLDVARRMTELPGVMTGGHVRDVLAQTPNTATSCGT